MPTPMVFDLYTNRATQESMDLPTYVVCQTHDKFVINYNLSITRFVEDEGFQATADQVFVSEYQNKLKLTRIKTIDGSVVAAPKLFKTEQEAMNFIKHISKNPTGGDKENNKVSLLQSLVNDYVDEITSGTTDTVTCTLVGIRITKVTAPVYLDAKFTIEGDMLMDIIISGGDILDPSLFDHDKMIRLAKLLYEYNMDYLDTYWDVPIVKWENVQDNIQQSYLKLGYRIAMHSDMQASTLHWYWCKMMSDFGFQYGDTFVNTDEVKTHPWITEFTSLNEYAKTSFSTMISTFHQLFKSDAAAEKN